MLSGRHEQATAIVWDKPAEYRKLWLTTTIKAARREEQARAIHTKTIERERRQHEGK